MRIPTVSLGMDVAPPAYIPIGQLIANGDLSTGNMVTLAASINSIPFEPTFLGDRKLYTYESEMTNTIALEFDNQVINLVQSTAPGTAGQETILNSRSVKFVTAPRIARKVTVRATEVAGIRALGSTQLDTVETRADRLLRNAVRDIRTTIEYHRVGGALGLLLDADGTTVLQNYFTLLGVSQTQIDVTFGTPASNKFILLAEQILNSIEDGLGNLAMTGMKPPMVLCGRTFFQRFVGSADVINAFQYFQATAQAMNPLRDDIRYDDFLFGGIIWRQYRGAAANSGRFIPDAEAHVVVEGIPGTYGGYFCPPADIVDKVNTPGEPIYPTFEVLPHGRGYEIELQSNPIHVMNRPLAAIKLISSN